MRRLLERGVHLAPYTVDSYEVLVVIDRHGRARKHLKLTPGISEERAVAWLEKWLDRLDPGLKLVEAGRPARRIDPGLYSTPLSDREELQRYRRVLARAAAARLPTGPDRTEF